MRRILSLSNDPLVIAQLTLLTNHYAIEFTDDMDGAIALASQDRFDFYVLDGDVSDLSVMNFYALIHGWHRDCQIIYLSHDGSEKESVLSGGADIFIQKPDGVSGLASSIDSLLDLDQVESF